MERIAVFPGSFDPFTLGHKAVLDSALSLFDKVIVAIGVNSSKKSLFSVEERLAYISKLYSNNSNISVKTYNTLTVDLCREWNAKYIVRGLRSSADFKYEQPIAQTNRQIAGVETVFLMTPPEYSHISSSIVRELLSYGADVSAFVPKSLNYK
ncbi:MAG: pantetheine-phosphate adenylyltransferase [Bacteroidales bacterium]|nr:pantetheine-phosphate adenylyltransferase [Bacteroidales bacterium]